ncbi:P-loop containing nucleoside triphosphate hydrolase protein [Punctularia strigosozonata HHB-11173 SS5]|uniref:P-loop containing nucleoside triphosphate hydrolase protein n=1 Tax=Punctularia strigosozonata (strain HHB-11173) TaxID=741275 RepID=UPI0004418543|nr:P-loop containing nucleoside triphosphate hydrolase protein [Punctularia strigosozonata HHB-11173 SS5]EIN14121.1 P-loop containing nucleoside triphosphate hydrolase protein [Punctularia strigosozonata HHB-11173 SS5]
MLSVSCISSSTSILRTGSCSRSITTVAATASVAYKATKHNGKQRLAKPKKGQASGAQLPFEAVGIRPPLAIALHAAFPNVQNPTEMQAAFIPAVLQGKDVLLADSTGTGKSFGLVLALLNKARVGPLDRDSYDNGTKPPINSLFIVPHRDLAYQLHHWIGRIVDQMPPSPFQTISSVATVLVRSQHVPLATQIAQLHADPPHILIATPNALADVFLEDETALQKERLSSVVIDEVDNLIESIPRSKSKFEQQKFLQKQRRHPAVTSRILKHLFAHREYDPAADPVQSIGRPSEHRRPLQLIMTSATFRHHLHEMLFRESGLLTRDEGNLVKINRSSREESVLSDLGGSNIGHCVLLVSKDGGVRNIDGSMTMSSVSPSPVMEAHTSENILATANSRALPAHNLSEQQFEMFSVTPSPFNADVMEVVATAFALDVPRLALLVVPADAPVQRAVYDLRQLGVNAYGLDLSSDSRGRTHLLRGPSDVADENPTLLVSTLASTRGLDLPELSHVFVLGMPTKQRVDTYLHIAGRVGRFGRGGKVVTLLEEERETVGKKGEAKVVREGERMSALLRQLDITPVRFEHFD